MSTGNRTPNSKRSATAPPTATRAAPRWIVITIYVIAAVVVLAFVSGIVFLR